MFEQQQNKNVVEIKYFNINNCLSKFHSKKISVELEEKIYSNNKNKKWNYSPTNYPCMGSPAVLYDDIN